MNLLIATLTETVLLPMAAAVLMALVWFRIGKPSHISGALGLVAGFGLGFGLIAGFNEFPPVKMTNWLPYFALISCLPFAAFSKVRFGFRWLLPGLLIAGFLFVLLKPFWQRWELWVYAAWFLGLAVVWLSLWMAWEIGFPAPDGLEARLLMVLSVIGVSLVAVLDGSAIIGQLAGVLVACLCGLFLLALKRPEIPLARAGTAVFFSLFGSFLVMAYFYVEVDPLAVGLACLPPLCCLGVRLPWYRRRLPWQRYLVLVGAAAIIIFSTAAYLYVTTRGEEYGY